MISRPRRLHLHNLIPSINTKIPNTTKFSSSPQPQHIIPNNNNNNNKDTSILSRFHHKDWLTPKQATNLLNSLTHPSSALTLFHLYSFRKDYTPTESFCTSLITKLAQAHQFGPIQTLLHSLSTKRHRFSDDFFFTLIKLYAHVANRIDKAVETLFQMPNYGTWPTLKTFNFVLNLLVNNKLYDVVFEVYASASKLGIEVDACCLNILIKGLCSRGELAAAFKVFDEFPKLGLERNARTFCTLMHGLCEKGKVDDAFGLLERMEKEGVDVDVVVYNVLIGGCMKKKRVEEGKEVLEMMMRKGCYPNEGSYQGVLDGLICDKRFYEAKGILMRMVEEGFGPSYGSYKGLILGMCKEGDVEEVDWLVRAMVRRGFVPRMGLWRGIVRCVVFNERDSLCVSFDGILKD